jgi:hypothetical protein
MRHPRSKSSSSVSPSYDGGKRMMMNGRQSGLLFVRMMTDDKSEDLEVRIKMGSRTHRWDPNGSKFSSHRDAAPDAAEDR